MSDRDYSIRTKLVIIDVDEESGVFIATTKSYPGKEARGHTIDDAIANLIETISLLIRKKYDLIRFRGGRRPESA